MFGWTHYILKTKLEGTKRQTESALFPCKLMLRPRLQGLQTKHGLLRAKVLSIPSCDRARNAVGHYNLRTAVKRCQKFSDVLQLLAEIEQMKNAHLRWSPMFHVVKINDSSKECQKWINMKEWPCLTSAALGETEVVNHDEREEVHIWGTTLSLSKGSYIKMSKDAKACECRNMPKHVETIKQNETQFLHVSSGLPCWHVDINQAQAGRDGHEGKQAKPNQTICTEWDAKNVEIG